MEILIPVCGCFIEDVISMKKTLDWDWDLISRNVSLDAVCEHFNDAPWNYPSIFSEKSNYPHGDRFIELAFNTNRNVNATGDIDFSKFNETQLNNLTLSVSPEIIYTYQQYINWNAGAIVKNIVRSQLK